VVWEEFVWVAIVDASEEHVFGAVVEGAIVVGWGIVLLEKQVEDYMLK
jgi:hypothetical protein